MAEVLGFFLVAGPIYKSEIQNPKSTDSVASAVFCLIKGLVRFFHQRGVVLPIFGKSGNTNTDRYTPIGLGFTPFKRVALYPPPYFLGHCKCFPPGGRWQNDGKLLPSVPGQEVGFSQAAGQYFCQGSKQLVALLMTVAVIVLFKNATEKYCL